MLVGIIELLIVGGTILLAQVGLYFVLRYRVFMLEKNFDAHTLNDTLKHENDNKRIDAGFKRIDSISDKVIILEQDSKSHLDLETAEAKFITRKELELHLEIIEKGTSSINDQVKLLMGKQDDIPIALNNLTKSTT